MTPTLPTTSPPPRRLPPSAVWFPPLLLLLTLLTYAPTLHARFIWDDDSYLTANPTLNQPDALRRIWFEPSASPQYYPMVFTTLYVEKSLWGLDPLGYHLVNILLHAASAMLLWLILRRLKVPAASLAAILFAVHPLAVESVAWITELKNTEAGFFALLSVLLYLPLILEDRTAEQPAEKRRWDRRQRLRYAGSLLLFILAMLSKTVACGVAPVLLLILWWKRERLTRRDVDPLLPFFIIGAGLGLLTARLEVKYVGAFGPDFAFNPGDRLLIAGRALWFYAGKTLWPFHLAFFYRRWGIDVRVWWQWLFPLAALAVFLLLWKVRRRTGKGILAGLAAFAALLFPALGFFNVYPMLFSFVADHFAYLALMAGIPLATAALACLACRFLPDSALLKSALAVPLVALFAWQSFRTAENYQDEPTLWAALLNTNQHWMAYDRLAWIDLHRAVDAGQAGDIQQAHALAKEVLNLDARAIQQKPDRAETHDDDALAYIVLGDPAAAEAEARKGIALAPYLNNGYQALARALYAQGKKDEAVAAQKQGLAALFGRSESLRPALELELGKTLFNMGRDQEAQQALQSAAAGGAGPEAWQWLGTLYAAHDQPGPARDAFQHALQLDPKNTEALDGLARITAIDPHATPDELQQALAAAQTACTAQPSARHFDTLGMVRFRLGDSAGAQATARQALIIAAPDERPLIQQHLQHYAAP